MTKWQPTQEQIEAVANTILTVQRSCTGHQNDVGRAWSSARAVISVLAPMVAEECAKIAREGTRVDMAPISQAEITDAYETGGDVAANTIRSRFNLPAK